jgi:hypothetical protein
MENKNTTCKNCEKEFQVSFKFCPNCGQNAKEDLTIRVLFYNTISNYFDIDARFFKSLIPLMFRPGYLARKFVEGKRLQYLHPAQYYLFASVIFFFIFSFQAREYNQKVDKALKKGFESDNVLKLDTIPKKTLDSVEVAKLTQPLRDNQTFLRYDEEEIEKLDSMIANSSNKDNNVRMDFGYDKHKLDSLIAAGAPEAEQLKAMGMKDDDGFFKKRFYTQLLKFQKNSGGGILQAFIDSIPIALFVLLPIFAFILKVFFWRRGRFSHHLVFSFYYYSFLFVLWGLVLLANLLWEVPSWINLMTGFSAYLYLLLAVKHFYRQGYILSFFKTGIVTFIFLLFVLPIALSVMVAASFLFY